MILSSTMVVDGDADSSPQVDMPIERLQKFAHAALGRGLPDAAVRPAEFVAVRMTQNATGTTVESVLAHLEGR